MVNQINDLIKEDKIDEFDRESEHNHVEKKIEEVEYVDI